MGEPEQVALFYPIAVALDAHTAVCDVVMKCGHCCALMTIIVQTFCGLTVDSSVTVGSGCTICNPERVMILCHTGVGAGFVHRTGR